MKIIQKYAGNQALFGNQTELGKFLQKGASLKKRLFSTLKFNRAKI